MPRSVLVVDDDPTLREVLRDGLGQLGFAVRVTDSVAGAVAELASSDVDAVVTDLHLGSATGLDLSRQLAANRPDVPVIVVTAFGNLESAIAAIRAGAYDFILKPFEIDALGLVLDRALERRGLREEVKRLREELGNAAATGEILGESAPIRRVRDLVARLADSDASVLLTGESGTGKELVARALHEAGRWKAGRFVALNCAAMPETLIESELFGTTKGAFTGAGEGRPGLISQAHQGTLFLDEVCEMPLGVQPKLLRALQERQVRPVGGTREVPFECRIVSATNRDLEAAVEEKRFRADLYFRLNVVEIALPPLRVRLGDVLPLTQHFIETFAKRAGKRVQGLSSEAARLLLGYAWPGNVRELENCIQRAVALTQHEQITPADLPDRVREPTTPRETSATDLVSLEEAERRHILLVLAAVGENKSLASQILGLNRRTLYRKLEQYAASPGDGATGDKN